MAARRRTFWLGAFLATLVLALGASGSVIAASTAAADPAQPGGPVPQHPLNPTGADRAFASVRGPGYVQALLKAQDQASHTPLLHTTYHGVAANWTPLGPAPIVNTFSGGNSYGGNNSGRITGLAFSGSNLLAATAGGGVWSTATSAPFPDPAPVWSTTTDNLPNIAMGAVAVDPSNPSVVFAGTGEDNNLDGDSFFGDGVVVSTDGGQTWNETGSGIPFGTNIASIAVEPGAPSLSSTVVLVGTNSNLYVSTNGGGTWVAESRSGWVPGNVYSVVINPLTTPITIYAGVGNTSGVSGVGVEESTDNGDHWNTLTFPVSPAASLSNSLAIVPNASPASTILYASLGGIVNNGSYVGMFKSTNGGSTWNQIPNCTSGAQQHCLPFVTGPNYAYNGNNNDGDDQSWYDNAVAVDPQNPNIVVTAGLLPAESTNGGTDWVNLNGQSYFAGGTNLFHPDFHALQFDSSGDLYIGNDGGAWEISSTIIDNPTPATIVPANVENLNTNLNVTQFFPGLSQVGDGSMIIAGAQDNGSSVYSSSSVPSTGWAQFEAGDGGATLIDPANPQIIYAQADITSYPTGGGIDLSTQGVTDPNNQTALTLPVSNFNWFAPFLLVPPGAPTVDGLTLYLGGNGVFKTTDGGGNWLPLAATSYSGSKVSALALAPSDSQVIYAGYNDGTVQVSSDGGNAWTTLVSANAAPFNGATITHIDVSPTDPGTAYFTTALVSKFQNIPNKPGSPQVVSGTGLNSVSPQFTDETGNLPAQIPTNSVVSDGVHGLVVANDVGVFWAGQLQGPNTVWSRLGTGLPNVQVMDLTRTPNGTIIAITHGRGAWTFPFSVTATTTSLSSSRNPAAVGQPVTYTAQVTPSPGVGATPTGTVSFASNGTPINSCSAVPVSGGTATCTTSYTSTGSYGPITATYSGDNSFTASTSTPLTEQVLKGGYWEVGADGGIFSYGSAGFFGSTGALTLAAPIVGMTPTPDGNGYWFVGSDGGVFAYGDAGYFGSMGGRTLNARIVAMAATADGRGYWLVGADGGIFAFGDARYFGSMGSQPIVKPIVGMAADSSTGGYWLVGGDGGIYAFNAPFKGSTGNLSLNAPVVAMTPTADDQGYWLVASDGGVFAEGDAGFLGSMGGRPLNRPIVGMSVAAQGAGYWLVAADGGLFAFGAAPFFGSAASMTLNRPVVGMAPWG